MKNGKLLNLFKTFLLLNFLFLSACNSQDKLSRQTADFNFDWKFQIGDVTGAEAPEFKDTEWRSLNLPHDWSIEQSYTTENTASSTGFLPTGIGWYRKTFSVPETDKGKTFRIEFDGVYKNAEVFLNGELLGKRPSGYISFSYDLSDKLNFGSSLNVIAVKVDHSAYADSRWYAGSGIYRNVRLISTSPIHIPKWGVQITTPEITPERAKVSIKTVLKNRLNESGSVDLVVNLIDPSGKICRTITQNIELKPEMELVSELEVQNPELWDLETPNLYSAQIHVSKNGQIQDEVKTVFGIRTAVFDENKGFILNGKQVKIKGVNLHHDAGLLGAAVPKDIWKFRIEKLKSIGCNAIRMAHNPHSPELMALCDEMGMLVMAEAFDEWMVPKAKSKVFLSDNAAPKEFARSYTEDFHKWSEIDTKDLVRRDFNHPSVILWSIGNEIEWTFPYYSAAYNAVNGKQEYNTFTPEYDSLIIRTAFNKLALPADSLVLTAEKLAKWVKEIDTSRPTTIGSVHPSVGMAAGLGNVVDVMGFNYRAVEYDKAHKHYPNLKFLGSENWGSWSEWKNVKDRDFVAGMFAWTGFAYLGEAGPWPRKGLEISFFDFAGFKTPRGHFYECLWNDEPKVYMVTTPSSESEYSFSPEKGWEFKQRTYAIPAMTWLRRWEWDIVYEKWNYKPNESIIVQAYTNCEEAELFLNGESLGKKSMNEFDDQIIKWQLDYEAGELKLVGYTKGEIADEYSLKSQSDLNTVSIKANREKLLANSYDVTVIELELLDKNKTLLTDSDQEITFEFEDGVKLLGVDNGWEMNVQDHNTNKIVSHNGKAIAIFQAMQKKGSIKLFARVGDLKSNEIIIKIE